MNNWNSLIHSTNPPIVGQVVVELDLRNHSYDPFKVVELERLRGLIFNVPLFIKTELDNQDKLVALISECYIYNVFTKFYIEHSGTDIPHNDLFGRYIDHIVSPKLGSSGISFNSRFKESVMRLYAAKLSSTFKFFISDDKDLYEARDMVELLNIEHDRVWFLPNQTLRKNASKEAIKEFALVHYFNYADSIFL